MNLDTLYAVRWYSELGRWWVPFNVDLLLSFGVIAQGQPVLTGVLLMAAFSALSAAIGYADVHYLKRIQKQNEFNTRLNTYLLEQIRQRGG